MSEKWLFLDFDNCQMATEHLAIPSLIKRFNDLYATQTGVQLTYEEFQKNFHGQARETLCLNLSKHFEINVDYATLYEAREWRMMQMLKELGVEMADKLIETLESLQENGYRFAFVSNNPIQRGLAAMRYATNGQGDQLARFFGTAFFEAGDIQKPKPDVYLRAMEQVGASPQNCYAVEDSPTGVTAAVAAGIPTFGFLGFSDDPQGMDTKLREKGAIACFDHWQDLPSLLLLAS
jgi:HAD superfamily hydrolase (TIGR01509 family)